MMRMHPRPKILIVDDDPAVCSMLLSSLAEERCECVVSDSAFDAANKITQERFSLVMSDVRMPGMTGMDLLRFIRERDEETSVVMITGVKDINTAIDCLRIGACDYITKPFDLLAIRRSVDQALERHQLMVENRQYQEALERKVRERKLKLKSALHDIEESYKITLESLVTALDAREHETRAHSQRVREYSLTLGRQLGRKEEELVEVGRGALLHDVGKIGVPDSILLKPGKLTPDEWVEMKKHPQIGYEILEGIKFLAPAAEIVLAHQERFDGKGYPNGLRCTEIPLGARVFAVADTLDAMTSDRPYRKALPFGMALDEVYRCSGTQFDPIVAEAFLSIPPNTWSEIHDTVNLRHRTLDGHDVLCRT